MLRNRAQKMQQSGKITSNKIESMTFSYDLILNSIKSVFKSLGGTKLNLWMRLEPSFNLRKIGRHGIMLKPQSVERFALVTNRNSDHLPYTGKALAPRNLSQGSKDKLWCPKCRTQGHTLDWCWKIHGKPSYKDKGNKEKQQRNRSQAHMTVHHPNENTNTPSKEFNKEEIEQLRAFLTSLGKLPGTCSLTQSDASTTPLPTHRPWTPEPPITWDTKFFLSIYPLF